MRIYQLSVPYPQEGYVISYHSSKAAANKAGKHCIKHPANEGDAPDDFNVYRIEFPATKKGILQMLETHTPGHDNG